MGISPSFQCFRFSSLLAGLKDADAASALHGRNACSPGEDLSEWQCPACCGTKRDCIGEQGHFRQLLKFI